MTSQSIILFVSVSFVISVFLTKLLQRGGVINTPQDIPNHRSLHDVPVPRAGGIAILVAIACSVLLMSVFNGISYPLFYFGLLPLILGGVLDDWMGLNPIVRLFLQFVSALTLWVIWTTDGGLHGQELLDPFWAPLLIVGTVWAINAYNFMDGMDGFAGSMGGMGFLVFMLFGILNSDWVYTLWNATIAAAVFGFLVFNWPKASIFLGDTGSTSIGYLSVAMAVWGVSTSKFPLWVPFLVFSPFWVDATVTLVKRGLRGEKVWEAHREHYYQRLVLMGWGHKKTLYVEIALMAACAVSAIGGTFLSAVGQTIVVATWVLVYVIILTAFPIFERHHSS